MMKFILTATYIIMTTSGIYLIKLGGDSLTVSFKNGFSFSAGLLTILGLLAYLCSFLLWQKLLTTFDLTYIVPITTGICQLLILAIGLFAFKENINWVGLIGVLFVIAGVVMIAIGKK